MSEDNIVMTLKCPEQKVCGRVFRISVSREHEGKKIKVECPSCCCPMHTVVTDPAKLKPEAEEVERPNPFANYGSMSDIFDPSFSDMMFDFMKGKPN